MRSLSACEGEGLVRGRMGGEGKEGMGRRIPFLRVGGKKGLVSRRTQKSFE